MPADVTSPPSVAALFDAVRDRWGRLDLLVNNAGLFGPAAQADEIDLADWQRVVDTNLTGAFLCAQHAVRMMKAQDPRGGRIINNGSISAHTPRPNSIAYTATKHAVTGLTKSLSLDGRAFDIACGQIDIGNAETELTKRFSRGVLQANGSIAAEPVFDSRHVADAVLYMASLPLDANVQFLTITATKMPYIGRGDLAETIVVWGRAPGWPDCTGFESPDREHAAGGARFRLAARLGCRSGADWRMP